MPRRNANAEKGGNAHRRGGGGGWMHGSDRKKKGGEQRADRAPLTPGGMHSKTRLR